MVVIFGAGRLQELYYMKLRNSSHIKVDPSIDVSRLNKNKDVTSVIPYDISKLINV